jgi:ion channel
MRWSTCDVHRRGLVVRDAESWASAAMTTVGYGDRYPTTPGGRAVGFALMLAGIACSVW